MPTTGHKPVPPSLPQDTALAPPDLDMQAAASPDSNVSSVASSDSILPTASPRQSSSTAVREPQDREKS
jgi:hypothetical protein